MRWYDAVTLLLILSSTIYIIHNRGKDNLLKKSSLLYGDIIPLK